MLDQVEYGHNTTAVQVKELHGQFIPDMSISFFSVLASIP